MILRPATIANLNTLKHWDTQQHVIDCCSDIGKMADDWNWKKELKLKDKN